MAETKVVPELPPGITKSMNQNSVFQPGAASKSLQNNTNTPNVLAPSAPSALTEPIKMYAPGPVNAKEPGVVIPEIVIPHELWSPSNAFAFILFTIMFIGLCVFGLSVTTNMEQVKNDWANQRCSPLIMPFASMFGHDTKDNFEFCMGKIFTTNSASSMDSVGSMFGSLSSLLSSTFNSINSMRNTISTLGGGINLVFKEFTDRITMFFFTLRMSAIRLKMMFGRIYAILFSVMYMGMSGITGMSSFTNTYLFSFLDTFCFPGSTEVIIKGKSKPKKIEIKDVRIGDVLLPGNCKVTATFAFHARGQPMVKIGSTIVSTNHYLIHHGKYIKAVDHPHAVSVGNWNTDDYLYCLNTDNHRIPIGILDFLDYDETSDADKESMRMVEGRINATVIQDKPYPFKECGFGLAETERIWIIENGAPSLKLMSEICIGDQLSTGSQVCGIIRKQVSELCVIPSIRADKPGVIVTPSTLFWDNTKWIRFGEKFPIKQITINCCSLIVTPNSQIELENGIYVRDYMELCSPDAELYYSKHIEH